MLIYPLHCRLPPPSFKMWLFSDGQGNFDPLRLLWSETPFNRSSMQEFKLILSLRPQPLCWDAQSKLKLFEAARDADSQQSWKHFLMLTFSASDLLLMGCTPIFFSSVCAWKGMSVWYLRTAVLYFFSRKLCSLQITLFAPVFQIFFPLFFLRQTDTLLYVALLLKSLLLWFWLLCS